MKCFSTSHLGWIGAERLVNAIDVKCKNWKENSKVY